MSNAGFPGSFYNWGSTPVATTPSAYQHGYLSASALTPSNVSSAQSPCYYNNSYVAPSAHSAYYQQQPSINNKSLSSSGYGSELNNSTFNSPNNYLRNYPVYNNYSSTNASFSTDSTSPNYFPRVTYSNQVEIDFMIIKSFFNSQFNLKSNDLNKIQESYTLDTSNQTRQNKRSLCDTSSFDTEAILNEIFQNSEPAPKKAKRAYNKKSKVAPTTATESSNEIVYPNYPVASNYQISPISAAVSNQATEYLSYNEVLESDTHGDYTQDDENDLFEDDNDENSLSYSINSFGEKKKRVLSRTQRVAANQRERKRMNIMNDSYTKLRQVLPISTGRKRRKMSRLDIVVGAMEYISYLAELVERDEPCEIKFDIFKNSLYTYD